MNLARCETYLHNAPALTFVAVSVALLWVALLTSYVPARRAGRIDPVRALSGE